MDRSFLVSVIFWDEVSIKSQDSEVLVECRGIIFSNSEAERNLFWSCQKKKEKENRRRIRQAEYIHFVTLFEPWATFIVAGTDDPVLKSSQYYYRSTMWVM